MATGAAPTYFDPVHIIDSNKIDHKLVDGGLNSNSPVMIAFAEAQVMWPNRKIFIISLGTGQEEVDYKQHQDSGWSVISDLISSAFGSLFSAKESTNSFLLSVFAHLDLLDVTRLNPKIDPTKTAMDDPQLLYYWRQRAKLYCQQKDVQMKLNGIVNVVLQCQQFNILKEAQF